MKRAARGTASVPLPVAGGLLLAAGLLGPGPGSAAVERAEAASPRPAVASSVPEPEPPPLEAASPPAAAAWPLPAVGSPVPEPTASGDPGPERVEREVFLMGTRLRGIAWARGRKSGIAALEAAFRAVEAEERLLSTWREGTELARLNGTAPGSGVRVSSRLFGLLKETWSLSRATGGSFDPAVGALVDAWDLRGEGRRPAPEALRSARAASGRECFRLGPGRRVTRRCPGAWIDAGAFGKGSGLRRARRVLEEGEAGAALLDFGGQLVALGSPPDRPAWRAAVAHPAERGRPVARLRLRDRSAATTSSSERRVVIDGEPRGHVLDPRTGRPAPAWGSVTVVAEDPLRADALSTGLFVMGPEEGWRWARGRENVGVLFLATPSPGAESGRPIPCWNAAMESYLAEEPGPARCPPTG